MGNIDSSTLGIIISGASTIIGTFGGILASGQITKYRIGQLEKKVDKHNSLIERTYVLEKNQELMCERMKVADHRIENLESDVKEIGA